MNQGVAEPDRVRFRRLAYLTAALTFALIVVGGVVVVVARLGCCVFGGWPVWGGAMGARSAGLRGRV